MQTKAKKTRNHGRGPKGATVHISLSSDLREFIIQQAEKEHRNVSNYISATLLRIKSEIEAKTPFETREKSEVSELRSGTSAPSARTA